MTPRPKTLKKSCKATCKHTTNSCGNSATVGSEYCRVHKKIFDTSLGRPQEKISEQPRLMPAPKVTSKCQLEFDLINQRLDKYFDNLEKIQIQLNNLIFITIILITRT